MSQQVTAHPSGIADVALGASAGASLGAVAGSLIAAGAALSIAVPFVTAGVAGAVGAYYGWAHKPSSRGGRSRRAVSSAAK